MIGYLKGKILSLKENSLLIENNGIGYETTCSSQVMKKATLKGEIEVFTYMAVKEDGIYLYGFISSEEKEAFLKLISVSGVGPKMGISVLSQMSLEELALKIATSDTKGLSAVKGLGKKTAERIILELREKFGKIDSDTGEVLVGGEVSVSDGENGEDEDAVIALGSLGFTRIECVKAIKAARAKGATTVQELIAYALKNMR